MGNEPKGTEPFSGPTPAAAGGVGDGNVAEANQAAATDIAGQMDAMLNDSAAATPQGAPAQEVPAQDAAVDGCAKKKSKLPLIAALAVIGALLIGGGVFGVVWMTNQHKPENVVLGSIMNAMSEKGVKLSGNVNLSGEAMEMMGISKLSISSTSEGVLLPSAQEATISITPVDEGIPEIKIKVGGVVLADGVLYFKVDGLMDILEQAMPDESSDFTEQDCELLTYDDDNYYDCISAYSTNPFAIGTGIFEMVEGVVEEIDGAWWKFDLKGLGIVPDEVIESYDCAIETMASINTDATKKELGELYKDWPLLDVAETGEKDGDANGYEVTLNAASLAGFANNFRDTGLYAKIKGCVEMGVGEVDDFEDVKAEDIELPEDMPTIILFANPWSHTLKSMTMRYEANGMVLQSDVKFEFVDAINISAPEGARSVMELAEMVMVEACKVSGMEEDECLEVVEEGLSGMLGGAALESLQYAQADTVREDNLARFLTAITDYQANNSGRLPFEGGVEQAVFVERYIDKNCKDGPSSNARFNCAGGESFHDPDGVVYSFVPAVVGGNAGTGLEVTNLPSTVDYKIYYAVGHACGVNEGTVRLGSGPRQIALLMVLSNGQVTCHDNQ